MIERNIGIVGDGATDREIFKTLLKSLITGGDSSVASSLNFVELQRQNLHDSVMKYWQKASSSNNYYRPAKHAVQFQDEVAGLLDNALRDFENSVQKGYLTYQDILLITTDAEREFSAPHDFFKDWGISIFNLLTDGIKKFYEFKVIEGYQQQYLPLILSLVTFPSTEILIAAARGEHQIYGKKAGDLKQMIYGTTDLSTLGETGLRENALDFLTPDGIENIFKIVPETRQFIQTLSLACLNVTDH